MAALALFFEMPVRILGITGIREEVIQGDYGLNINGTKLELLILSGAATGRGWRMAIHLLAIFYIK